jgi:hypothetical protein
MRSRQGARAQIGEALAEADPIIGLQQHIGDAGERHGAIELEDERLRPVRRVRFETPTRSRPFSIAALGRRS